MMGFVKLWSGGNAERAVKISASASGREGTSELRGPWSAQ